MFYTSRLLLVSFLVLSCFGTFGSAVARLPDDEVEILKQIGKTLGKTNWTFSVDPCSRESGWITPKVESEGYENNVTCNCSFANNTICHVERIVLNGQNLRGVLPPEFAKLPYLQHIDLRRNLLHGTIPKEWGTMSLVEISLLGNRLSGGIPKELGNINTLTDLVLESNRFSGPLTPELGNLVNIERILVSSNEFTGELPGTLANLTNLRDFRISDNNFTGKIPDFIQNWRKLEKLAIQASGLEGPIPPGISLLKNMTDMRISDINGTNSTFPLLINMKGMKTLILRNCNLSGSIPPYVGRMTKLETFDLSYNKLSGQIPYTFDYPDKPRYMYLTGNLLAGDVPDWMLNKGHNIDLSYNNFTVKGSAPPECQLEDVNFFGTSSMLNNSGGVVPCLKNFTCPKTDRFSLHINCGGWEVRSGKITYMEDKDTGGASKFFRSSTNYWAFSSTGHFLDNPDNINTFIESVMSIPSFPNSEVYRTARISPLSLTYYGLCLINGSYNVSLHFAEIEFTADNTYKSLGKRIFDIYIQGKLVLKDFNIENEAGGPNIPIVKTYTTDVTTNTLEIRFYWAGKGTTSIPVRGTYGPLISAISVDPNFEPPSEGLKAGAVAGIVVSALFLIFLILGILWWKGCLGQKDTMDEDLRGLDLRTGSFTLRQIRAATNNFDPANKIGEGGFGSVYKGLLPDGTIIAVKQLSSKSRQGNREFLNEIGMISALQHPNLVKLYGCCIEAKQLLLVYEYMENNSLARALFDPEECQLQLDWPTRHRICIGIARGLAYLHEESTLRVVHRDIKATNVLLDRDLNPKISDFGLARLHEEEDTHISTRVAGTIGYMAPEYAMHGYLTDKADVYSFGVVTLEIVSGKSIIGYRPKGDHVHMVDWAHVLQQQGGQLELVDPRLGSEFNNKEAITMIDVALLCTSASPTLRPAMSAVVKMLGSLTKDPVSDLNLSSDDFNAKAVGNFPGEIRSMSSSPSHSLIASTDQPWTESSVSVPDLYPINPDSQSWSNIK